MKSKRRSCSRRENRTLLCLRTYSENAPISILATRKALAAARYKVDNVYSAPYNHNAIELHATLAHWSEDETSLTVYDATQYVIGIQEMLAQVFPRQSHVRVIGSFVGGGFGGKGNAWAHVSLAVAAAKVVKRPVKLMLSREGVHLTVGAHAHRTACRSPPTMMAS